MAVRLDGNDGYTRATDDPPNGSATMLGWAKISVDRNDWTTICCLRNYFIGGYALQTLADGTTISLYTSGNNVSGSSLTVGTWYHFALVNGGTGAGGLLLYLNGVLDITHEGAAGSINDFWFGCREAGPTEPLNGCLAGWKVYDAALGVDDIRNEMWSYVPKRTANLNSWHPFLNTSEDEIDFYNNRNLTVIGVPVTEDGPPISWHPSPSRMIYIPAAVGGDAIPQVWAQYRARRAA